MNNAYFILSNDDLLKEITKWHILQYLQFPNIFLEKLCDDKNIEKIKWLFLEGLVTIESLNKCVQDTFIHVNDYGGNVENFLLIVEMKTFIDYILFYKKCPKVFMYIIDNFKNERDNFITSELFKIDDFQQYLKTYLNNEELIYMEKYFKLTYVKTQQFDELKSDVNFNSHLLDGKNKSKEEMRKLIKKKYKFERLNNGIFKTICDNKPITIEPLINSESNDNNNFSIGSGYANNNQLTPVVFTDYDKINNLGNFINFMPRKISLPINHFGDLLPRKYPNIFTNNIQIDDYEGPMTPTFDLDNDDIDVNNPNTKTLDVDYFEYDEQDFANDDNVFNAEHVFNADYALNEQDFVLNDEHDFNEQGFVLNDDHVFNEQDFSLNDVHVFNKFNLGVTPSPRNTFVN